MTRKERQQAQQRARHLALKADPAKYRAWLERHRDSCREYDATPAAKRKRRERIARAKAGES